MNQRNQIISNDPRFVERKNLGFTKKRSSRSTCCAVLLIVYVQKAPGLAFDSRAGANLGNTTYTDGNERFVCHAVPIK